MLMIKRLFILIILPFIQCSTPEETEVLVIGGSASGIAAAISSARLQVSTILIEQGPWLGGMLTAAGVSATDGNYKLPSGFWGEFRDSLVAHYGSEEKLQTGWVSKTLFEPSVGNEIFQQLAKKEKSLSLYFHTNLLSLAPTQNGWTAKVRTEHGEKQIKAKIVIDATELGDVVKLAGIEYSVGMDPQDKYHESIAPVKANEVIQDMTYVLILEDYGKPVIIDPPAGYDAAVFYCSSQSLLCTGAKTMKRTLWPPDKLITYGALPNNKFMINWPINGNDYYSNTVDLTETERQAQYEKAKIKSLQFLYYLQTELGFSNLSLAENEFPTADHMPLIPYHRESRRIKGLVTLTVNDIAKPFEQKDPLYRTGIAVGDYPIDHHHAAHPDADQLPELHFFPVPSYTVPLGVLLPQKVKNFIVAEKSISVSNIVNGTTRLQPVVLQIGQAAGSLAALAVQSNTTPEHISVRTLQRLLLEQGGYLLPYLDVPKTHPHFSAYQRIGSTGILKGVGMNVGWENQTWFYPDSLLQNQSWKLDSSLIFRRITYLYPNH
ncbi:MAG: FAD-dependent oxidoreductase [Saprospiraceae bacterium]|nr:FAD-dependent oxidoreductase [Saprospiraceae bacterium]